MRNGNLVGRNAPALVIMSGLPGSGKTTFVHMLRARVPMEHVESDAIRRSLFAIPTYSSEESGRVFAAVERRAAAAIDAGNDVVVDATNLRRADRKRFLRLAAQRCATLVCVRITAPDDVIRARLASPRDGFSQAGADVFEAMKGRAQRFDTAHLVVDTRFDVAPSVEMVAAIVEAGGQ